jgi:hypothetical protein
MYDLCIFSQKISGCDDLINSLYIIACMFIRDLVSITQVLKDT